jgi:RNA-directed DNA polymerase
MHTPLAVQHKWLCSVLRGHYAYYGLPCNYRSMSTFRQQARRLWYRALKRRDRGRKLTWHRFEQLLERLPLPMPTITHPWQSAAASIG